MTWRRTVEKTWFVPPKPSRYHAHGVRDADGTFFHSGGEMKRWHELQMLEKAGEICNLRRQQVYDLLAYVHADGAPMFCGNFRPDFEYTDVHTGEFIIEDFKSPASAADEAYRLRKRWFEACYPFTVRETMRTKR